ncbi:hypothetical protein ACFL27_00350 [candidate division CSSED10-310 bacterium]|uniref:Sulfatase N-terminal domain-containing protein n=1 Tax=candidate division CSSED10-310 bacterium TaxID=2855610 RepID=A0ABV6YR10_UNCC1
MRTDHGLNRFRFLYCSGKINLFLLATFVLLISCSRTETDESLKPNPVVLVSLDAFRWDYQARTATPNLDYLVDSGKTRADNRHYFHPRG